MDPNELRATMEQLEQLKQANTELKLIQNEMAASIIKLHDMVIHTQQSIMHIISLIQQQYIQIIICLNSSKIIDRDERTKVKR